MHIFPFQDFNSSVSDASSVNNRTPSSLSNASYTPLDLLQTGSIVSVSKASTISDWVTFDEVQTTSNHKTTAEFDISKPPEIPGRKFSSNSVTNPISNLDLLSMDNDALSEHLSEKSFDISDSMVPPIPDRLMGATSAAASPQRNQLSPSPFDIRIPPPNATAKLISSASPMGSLKRRTASSRSQSSSSTSSVTYMNTTATAATVPPVPPRSLDKLVGDYVSFKDSSNDIFSTESSNDTPLLASSDQTVRQPSNDICTSG